MDPHTVLFTGAMFAMGALAADAIVEMLKHGAEHFNVWMSIRREVVVITDDCIELAEEEIEFVEGGEPGLIE